MATARILGGLNTAAGASEFLGSAEGSNLGTYSNIGKVTAIAGIGGGAAATFGGVSLAGLLGSVLAASTMGIGAVLAIVSKVFHGADPLQVPAAQTEQAFEAAADNFAHLARGGNGVSGSYSYMTPAEAVAAINKITQAGTAYFNYLLQTLPAAERDPLPFRNGLANMQRVNAQSAANVAAYPSLPVRAWNQADAERFYWQDGTPGWYSQPGESIDAARNLATAYMTALRASVATKVSAAVSSASSSAVTTVTKSKGFLWAALAAGAFAAWHFL